MSAFQDILDEPDDEVETPSADISTATAGDESEAVVEAPAPVESETSAPVEVAAEAQPITRDDGAAWNPNAKRWYKDGKIVAGEPPATPSEPSIPSVPAATAPVVPDVPAPVAPTYEGEAWQVRGGGQKHTIPGAIQGKDGWVHLSPEHQAQHKALFAAGIEHNTNWQREKQTFQQQVKDAEARGSMSATKYNKASVFLFDKLSSLLGENHPDELNMIRRELAIELKSADLEIPRAPVSNEPAPEQIEAAFSASLGSALDELLEDAPAGLFSAEDVADLRATYGRRMAAYAAEVDGSIMLDFHALRDDFAREVRIAQKANATAIAAREQAKKDKAAAAFNAANTPKAPAVPPKKPSPTPALAAVPSGKKAPSWDQAVKSAWDASDDDE